MCRPDVISRPQGVLFGAAFALLYLLEFSHVIKIDVVVNYS